MYININEQLSNGDDIIIYSAGVEGISVFCTLLNREIPIMCFCDKDPLKQEVHIMNKPVISPEMLVEKYKDAKIIIGSFKYAKEIGMYLKENGVKNIYEIEDKLDDKIWVGNIPVIRENWYSLICISRKKKVYIYGNGEKERELFRKMSIGGIHCEGMIEDLSQIRCAEFDDRMLIVPEENEALFEQFDEIGLVCKKHYRSLWGMREVDLSINKKKVLDVNLGVSYKLSEMYPGYAVLGDDNAKYKIMVLGSSTSHENYCVYRSWVYFLSERFSNEGASVQIFNGGISTYNAQMMTLKLLRDLPDIKPNMVICYSGGTNNGLYGYAKPEAPFSSIYILDAYNKAYRDGVDEPLEIYTGVRKNVPISKRAEMLAEDYLYTCDVMKAICDMKGVTFVNFFYGNAGMCDLMSLPAEDREVCYHYRRFMKNVRGRKIANQFYQEVKKQLRDWQYDHTELYRNTPGVYIDASHVNEEGNKLIAEDVYRIIKPMM